MCRQAFVVWQVVAATEAPGSTEAVTINGHKVDADKQNGVPA